MLNRRLPLNVSLIVLAVLFPAMLPAQPDKRVVGYFTSWSVYARDYHVSDISAEKLTHLNFAFANVVGGECVLGDPWADTQLLYPGDVWGQPLAGSFHQLQLLKDAHPHLKTLISLGGWTWSGGFSSAVATATDRTIFVDSCVNFMLEYGFDGIDIDWEYPVSGGLSGGSVADTANYTLFLEELRTALDTTEAITGDEYLLTIASAAGPSLIPHFDLAAIHPYLDGINVMTYDFHGGWSALTNHHAPLYHPSAGPAGYDGWSTHDAIQTYLAEGVPAEKLQVGVPFYGRGWSGVPDVDNGLFQPYSTVPMGTWEPGLWDYSDLMENIVTADNRFFDDESQAPWTYDAGTGLMVSYEDPESLGHKIDYVWANDLGGVMFWELSCDDVAETLLTTLSEGMTAAGGPGLRRGDCNRDQTINIADAIALLAGLFEGAPWIAECADACDANDDGNSDISDPIALLAALFSGGSLPAPVACGDDPTPDSLDCSLFTCP